MPFKTSKIGLSSRKAAWDVLKFVAAGAYADVALDRVLKRFDFDVVDRSFVMEIAYGPNKLVGTTCSKCQHSGIGFGTPPTYTT